MSFVKAIFRRDTSARPISSVTRWLLVVVIGCVVLETAQPMNAADEPAAQPADRTSDTLLIPGGTDRSVTRPASATDRSFSWVAIALFLGAGGAWLLWKRRGGDTALKRDPRKIQIEESRSLGNRQYLVVATYEQKKFLLGVTPGQIQMLAPLDEPKETES